LVSAEGIPGKNRIWLFRGGPEKLSADDLQKLKDIIKENYPSDAKINKTAIVIATASQSKMAESFAQIAADLPQAFKVFSNFTDAEDWVKE
jgi:hypothetical protein